MAGKQAKLVAPRDAMRCLAAIRQSRYPTRDRVIFLLSVKAGLRAAEIAGLTWPMVLDPTGKLSGIIELHDRTAKNHRGRSIPVHSDLLKAMERLRKECIRGRVELTGPVLRSERGAAGTGKLTPGAVVRWFATLYRRLGLEGCSSHSGRRTFVTNAARAVAKVGASLRDVQQLAGHASIETTQRYIEGDTVAKRRLVALL